MNEFYKFFLNEQETHFQNFKLNYTERIQKARQGYPIHSDLIIEINEREQTLYQELLKISLDDFLTTWNKKYMVDSQVSEEDAFIYCCNKYNITKVEPALTLLAKFKANEKIRSYCYELMNTTNKNDKNILNISYQNNINSIPIWQNKNQMEFLQLIEVLIMLERIKPRPNQKKWELINEIATFFGLKLSKHAISNLGKGRKSKLAPKLFDQLYKLWVAENKNLDR
jgi:hypothetical protein